MKKLELALLGQPDFKLDGATINDLVLRKGLALIAYLAVTKQSHSREALAGLFWGEMSEEKARRNLRVALTKLRKQFDDFLIIQRRTLAFDPDSNYWLDVELFEQNLNQPNPTTEQLQTAVNLYRGPFLADLPLRDALLFEEWVRPYQERLRQMAMEALYRLSVLNTQEGAYAQGIDNLGKLLQLEPWMEEAHRQMMLLFALSGQRSAALTQFEQCQAILDEELGVEPTEATIVLYEKILNEEIKADDTQIMPAPSPTIPIPFQAPAEKANFIGRQSFLTELGTTLQQPENGTIQAVVGMGGVGKSTVAIQLAHQLRSHFVDGVLWANAAVSEPHAVIESWAQLYGYDFSRMTDLESMAAALRSVLTDKAVLIILDDVTSITRIKPLLPTGAKNHVLLTTRDHDLARALDAQVWSLQELSPENGRILLASILGEKRLNDEPEAATEICNLLENLPLAVEIIGQRLKSRPRRRLADVAQRLRSEEQRLSELQISDRAVRASFAISYQSLDRDLRRMFALMGLFNGRSFSAEALAYIAQLDRYEAEDRIFALTALSLAQEDGHTRYKQHALLADFALEMLGDEDGAVEYGRFTQFYLHFAQQNQTNYDALRPEWENMMSAMEIAYLHQLWQTVIEFGDTLHGAWLTRGRFTQAREAYAYAKKAAQERGDDEKLAQIELNWGQACIEQNDYELAETHLDDSHKLFSRLEDGTGIAAVQFHRARIAIEQSQYDKAHRFLDESLHIRESLADQKGVAAVLYRQARIASRTGNYDEGFRVAQQALNIQKEQDRLGASKTVRLMASITLEQKKFSLAKQYCEDALRISIELQDTGELATSYYRYCWVSRQLGELEQAEAYGEKALALFAKIGDKKLEALTLYILSVIQEDKKNFERALELALQSSNLMRMVGDSYNLVFILAHLGDIYKNLQQFAKMQEYWKEALPLAEQQKHPEFKRLLARLEGVQSLM